MPTPATPAIASTPIVVVNNKQVSYQGIGHLRDDVATADAADKTKGNGLDEYILVDKNAQNKDERVLVYGDKLDFSFQKKNSVPKVTVDGRAATMVYSHHEVHGFFDGFANGLVDGFKKGFENASSTGSRLLEGIALTGGATFVGGSIFTIATHGVGLESMMSAVTTLGPTVATGTGLALAAGFGFIVLGTAFKDAFAALQNKPDTSAIAGLTTEANPNAALLPKPQPPANTPVKEPVRFGGSRVGRQHDH